MRNTIIYDVKYPYIPRHNTSEVTLREFKDEMSQTRGPQAGSGPDQTV
jgi:hypothetical protein